ncbi:MAG: MMPL family transporter, partial [Verrucomicrobiota bacterium]
MLSSSSSSFRFLRNWAALCHRARFFAVGLWVLITVASGYLAQDLDFRFSLGHMLRGEADRIEEVRDFYRTFPPEDGHAMVTASASEVLTIRHLEEAAAWADALEELPEVAQVVSVREMLDVRFEGFSLREWAILGGVADRPLEIGDGDGMGMFRGNLISQDLQSVAFYLIREKGVRSGAFYNALDDLESGPWENANLRVVGTAYLLREMGRLLQKSFHDVLLLQGGVLLVVVPLLLRSFRRAFLPLFAAGSAVAIYLALFVVADKSFGVMHLAGPGLILIVALADAIHFQQRFDEIRSRGVESRTALAEAFQSVGRACFLTSLTTACGFLSLLLARQEEVHDFGLWCAIGVGVSFVVVVGLYPALLLVFPGEGGRNSPRFASWVRMENLRRLVVPTAIVLVLIISGIHRLRIDSSLERELPKDSPVVQDGEWFATQFRGLDRVEVDVKADLDDPMVFRLIEEMQEELRRFPGVSGSRSYVDLIHTTLSPEVVETDDGPQLGIGALEAAGFPEPLLTRDLKRTCIVFYRTPDFGTDAFEQFRDEVKRFEKRLPEGSTMKLNGYLPMFYESTSLISVTLIQTLACTLGIITVLLMIFLRS